MCIRDRPDCASPRPTEVQPSWCPDLGDAVAHPDLPAGGVDRAVVEPAEQYTVVGMGAVGIMRVGVDVVDLAPPSRDVAPRDGAAPVAERDGTALVAGEAPLRRSELEDAAVAAEDHALDGAGAADVAGCGDADGSGDPVGEGCAASGGQVLRADADQQRRSVAGDAGSVGCTCRHLDDRAENVMKLLSAAALVGAVCSAPVSYTH